MTQEERNKKIEILKARLEFFGSESLRPYYSSFLRETRQELAELETELSYSVTLRVEVGH